MNLPNISEDILGEYHINAVYVRGPSQVIVICADTSGHMLEINSTNVVNATKLSCRKVPLPTLQDTQWGKYQ